MLYNRKLEETIINALTKFSERCGESLGGSQKVTFSNEEFDAMFKKYDESIPEFHDLTFEKTKDLMERGFDFVMQMLDHIDLSPAEHTVFIKGIVCNKNKEELQAMLAAYFQVAKASLKSGKLSELSIPQLAEASTETYKKAVLVMAAKKCAESGSITMRTAIKRVCRDVKKYGFDRIKSNDALEKFINDFAEVLNDLFKFICEHERDFFAEYVYFSERASIVERTIAEKYPDPKRQTTGYEDMFSSLFGAAGIPIPVNSFKHTEAYDRHIQEILEKYGFENPYKSVSEADDAQEDSPSET